MSTIKVVMKNGKEFVVQCEKFTANISKTTGQLVGYEFTDVKGNVPIYIDMLDVSYILEMHK